MKNKVIIRIELDPACGEPEVTIRTDQNTELVERLVSVIERCVQSDVPRIAVYDGNTAFLLDTAEILRIYTEPRKLVVCADSGMFESRCSLQEMEGMLISRFEIINMEKVHGFDVSVSGTIRAIFDDGSSTWVARRYVRAIEQRLERLFAKGGQHND